ncbi:unnamed protein product [Gadus morhua 'NCC']
MDFFDGHQPTDAAAQIPVGPDGQYKTGRPKYSKPALAPPSGACWVSGKALVAVECSDGNWLDWRWLAGSS